jgi:type IV secretory pathway VirB10-like protein
MKITVFNILKSSKLPQGLRNNPKLIVFILVVLVAVLGLLWFLGNGEAKSIKKNLLPVKTTRQEDKKEDKDVGVLTASVDTKSYILRIEKQYYEISAKADEIEGRVKELEKDNENLRKNKSDVSPIAMGFDKNTAQAFMKTSGLGIKQNRQGVNEDLNNPFSMAQPLKQALNLEMAKVAEIISKETKETKKSVYLPSGSFVKCTLLTGVYAPSNQNNPLPVLLSVDEAFYGPNNTRIPLKGGFAIGKAIGDLVSKRAIIQIVSFSFVLSGGHVFEHEANIGYLVDSDGSLGIQGEVIYNTGRQLGLNFLSGFLAGGAEALSQAETSTVTGAYGQTSKNVTGDTGRYAMFSGLANSSQGMASYYQKQLDSLVPAVKIEAGKKVTLVIQKGVEIEGLQVNIDGFGYID